MRKIILSPAYNRLAVVGLAKNVGKTTTLNWLVEEGADLGHQLGLASIGVDGEQKDVWNYQQKPAIEIKEGMWAASAKAALQDSSARFRIVEELKARSPMGPVYLLQCLQAGQIKLAGTQMRKDIAQMMERFSHYGVTLTLIDGAYNRLTSAHESISQGFILCTGAALDPTIEWAIAKTEEVLLRWQLPKWKELCSEKNINQEQLAYQKDGQWFEIKSSSLFNSVDQLRLLVTDGIDVVSIPGALTEWIIQFFTPCKKPFTWIVDDPTKIFLSQGSLTRWLRAGGKVYVRRKSELIAISVNPFSIKGEQDAEQWLYQIKKIAGDIPVIDVLRRKVV